jgi:hypothetical protein
MGCSPSLRPVSSRRLCDCCRTNKYRNKSQIQYWTLQLPLLMHLHFPHTKNQLFHTHADIPELLPAYTACLLD